jgi:hypothetical protein
VVKLSDTKELSSVSDSVLGSSSTGSVYELDISSNPFSSGVLDSFLALSKFDSSEVCASGLIFYLG